MYIRMRVLGSTFVSVGQVGINFSSFGEPVVLLVQLNVQEEGREQRQAQFGELKEVHQCI
jgi:hypothetical protein